MEAYAHAHKGVRLIQEILPIDVRDTAPASVVGALLTVSLQHCDSILLLHQTGVNDASAEALMRPMIESVLRLAWVVENEQRALQVTTKTTRFPKLSVLFRRLDQSSSKKTLTALPALHLHCRTRRQRPVLSAALGHSDNEPWSRRSCSGAFIDAGFRWRARLSMSHTNRTSGLSPLAARSSRRAIKQGLAVRGTRSAGDPSDSRRRRSARLDGRRVRP